MYRSKVRAWGNACTIKRWGEWRKVKLYPMKYAMPNYGGINLTGLEEAPKFRKKKKLGCKGLGKQGTLQEGLLPKTVAIRHMPK
jgi:hypothetical protein